METTHIMANGATASITSNSAGQLVITLHGIGKSFVLPVGQAATTTLIAKLFQATK